MVLESFYGLGNEFTAVGVEDFMAKLLVDEKIKKYCACWFFNYTLPYSFIGLLFDIGFFGLKRKDRITYKEPGKDSNAKVQIETDTHIVVHPTYQPALNLRPILIQKLSDDVTLKHEGILQELPENYRLDKYKEELQLVLSALQAIPLGHEGAVAFEEIVGKIMHLCFFRSLANIQPKARTHDGSTIKDWVASNRASGGFWSSIREKYGAMQVVWECKNYQDLHAEDFQQVSYYFSNSFGCFGVIAFRGDELKESYFKHVSNVANKNQAGLILMLTQRDLEVFLRQAIKGMFKESHIQDRFDFHVRQIS